MKPVTDQEGQNTSSIPYKESQKDRMENPRIHTTKYGTQFVDVLEVIQSDAGWAEIQRLKEANLVGPSRENGTNGSAPSSDKIK
jgi:hypothetical protein